MKFELTFEADSQVQGLLIAKALEDARVRRLVATAGQAVTLQDPTLRRAAIEAAAKRLVEFMLRRRR